ncbi:MAG: BON domain-containing protein [Planctomycetota bacterium]
MPTRRPTSDSELLVRINEKLQKRNASSRCSVEAEIVDGVVTLSGAIKNDQQRLVLTGSIQAIHGVRFVVDAMTVA